MRRNYFPLSDREIEGTSLRQLQLNYQSLRREYEDVIAELNRLDRYNLQPKGET